MKDLGSIMKQAQQMQAALERAREEIARIEVEGESGAGLVKVVMNGRHDVKRVQIDPSLTGDREMLEDLIAAACNDANRRLEKATQEKMSQLTAGMGLPPGIKL